MSNPYESLNKKLGNEPEKILMISCDSFHLCHEALPTYTCDKNGDISL